LVAEEALPATLEELVTADAVAVAVEVFGPLVGQALGTPQELTLVAVAQEVVPTATEAAEVPILAAVRVDTPTRRLPLDAPVAQELLLFAIP